MSDLDDFDPNFKHGVKTPMWASYVPDRSPVFKAYNNRGHAANALNSARRGVMYELVDGQWVEYARKERHDTCAHCGKTKAEGGRSWYLSSYGLNGGPEEFEFQKPRLCNICKPYFDIYGYGGQLKYEDLGKTQLELDV
jgi:hypothetical protein